MQNIGKKETDPTREFIGTMISLSLALIAYVAIVALIIVVVGKFVMLFF